MADVRKRIDEYRAAWQKEAPLKDETDPLRVSHFELELAVRTALSCIDIETSKTPEVQLLIECLNTSLKTWAPAGQGYESLSSGGGTVVHNEQGTVTKAKL